MHKIYITKHLQIVSMTTFVHLENIDFQNESCFIDFKYKILKFNFLIKIYDTLFYYILKVYERENG